MPSELPIWFYLGFWVAQDWGHVALAYSHLAASELPEAEPGDAVGRRRVIDTLLV